MKYKSVISITLIILLLLSTILLLTFKPSFSEYSFYKKKYKQYSSNPIIAYTIISKLLKYNTHDYPDINNFPEKEIFFLHTLLMHHIKKHPKDTNNGYYHMISGDFYKEKGAILQALKEYTHAFYLPPSPLYQVNEKKNSSIESLKKIIVLEKDPLKKIYYNTLVLKKYPSIIHPSTLYYNIGNSYYALGIWDKAYAAYRIFLSYPERVLDKTYTSLIQDRESIFFKSKRYKKNMNHRVWDSSEKARKAILNALYTKKYSIIQKLRAPGFFTSQWDENILDTDSYLSSFRIDTFLRRSTIYPSPTFSPLSTKTMKLWKIIGWERVSTWYFSFRKIEQPDIPYINGMWEWAGIYLGFSYKRNTPSQL